VRAVAGISAVFALPLATTFIRVNESFCSPASATKCFLCRVLCTHRRERAKRFLFSLALVFRRTGLIHGDCDFWQRLRTLAGYGANGIAYTQIA
jgi:hypothetical protein